MENTPNVVLIVFLVIVIVSAVWIFFEYLKGKTLDDLRGDAYQLILKAEHAYNGSKTGKDKMKYVVSTFHTMLPGWLKAFISEESLERLLETWFKEVKDLLDDGKVNGSAALEDADKASSEDKNGE